MLDAHGGIHYLSVSRFNEIVRGVVSPRSIKPHTSEETAMVARYGIAMACAVCVLMMLGCDEEPQQVVPAQQGGRGESCQARNDCESGLACISGVCSL